MQWPTFLSVWAMRCHLLLTLMPSQPPPISKIYYSQSFQTSRCPNSPSRQPSTVWNISLLPRVLLYTHVYHLPPDRWYELDSMEAMGIVCCSSRPWASPLHMVPKASGGWRPVEIICWYPTYMISQLICHFFSRSTSYKVIARSLLSQQTCPRLPSWGRAALYVLALRVPHRVCFGLKNAVQAFQRLMDIVCRGLDFIFTYLDDILEASRNSAEQRIHLHKLFQRLQDRASPSLSMSPRANLASPELISWGTASLIKASYFYPLPSTNSSKASFYYWFIPAAARMMSPLFFSISRQAQNPNVGRCNSQGLSGNQDSTVQSSNAHTSMSQLPTSLTVHASESVVGAGCLETLASTWKGAQCLRQGVAGSWGKILDISWKVEREVYCLHWPQAPRFI